MSQEGKPPDSGSPTDAPLEQRPAEGRADTLSSVSADAEKDAQVEAAKARVAAAKEAAQKGAAGPAPPKPPVKKKDEGPKPTDASNHPLVKKLREKLGNAVVEATEFLGQLSVLVERDRIIEVCLTLRDDPETAFNYLSDLTC